MASVTFVVILPVLLGSGRFVSAVHVTGQGHISQESAMSQPFPYLSYYDSPPKLVTERVTVTIAGEKPTSGLYMKLNLPDEEILSEPDAHPRIDEYMQVVNPIVSGTKYTPSPQVQPLKWQSPTQYEEGTRDGMKYILPTNAKAAKRSGLNAAYVAYSPNKHDLLATNEMALGSVSRLLFKNMAGVESPDAKSLIISYRSDPSQRSSLKAYNFQFADAAQASAWKRVVWTIHTEMPTDMKQLLGCEFENMKGTNPCKKSPRVFGFTRQIQWQDGMEALTYVARKFPSAKRIIMLSGSHGEKLQNGGLSMGVGKSMGATFFDEDQLVIKNFLQFLAHDKKLFPNGTHFVTDDKAVVDLVDLPTIQEVKLMLACFDNGWSADPKSVCKYEKEPLGLGFWNAALQQAQTLLKWLDAAPSRNEIPPATELQHSQYAILFKAFKDQLRLTGFEGPSFMANGSAGPDSLSFSKYVYEEDVMRGILSLKNTRTWLQEKVRIYTQLHDAQRLRFQQDVKHEEDGTSGMLSYYWDVNKSTIQQKYSVVKAGRAFPDGALHFAFGKGGTGTGTFEKGMFDGDDNGSKEEHAEALARYRYEAADEVINWLLDNSKYKPGETAIILNMCFSAQFDGLDHIRKAYVLNMTKDDKDYYEQASIRGRPMTAEKKCIKSRGGNRLKPTRPFCMGNRTIATYLP